MVVLTDISHDRSFIWFGNIYNIIYIQQLNDTQFFLGNFKGKFQVLLWVFLVQRFVVDQIGSVFMNKLVVVEERTEKRTRGRGWDDFRLKETRGRWRVLSNRTRDRTIETHLQHRRPYRLANSCGSWKLCNLYNLEFSFDTTTTGLPLRRVLEWMNEREQNE